MGQPADEIDIVSFPGEDGKAAVFEREGVRQAVGYLDGESSGMVVAKTSFPENLSETTDEDVEAKYNYSKGLVPEFNIEKMSDVAKITSQRIDVVKTDISGNVENHKNDSGEVVGFTGLGFNSPHEDGSQGSLAWVTAGLGTPEYSDGFVSIVPESVGEGQVTEIRLENFVAPYTVVLANGVRIEVPALPE